MPSLAPAGPPLRGRLPADPVDGLLDRLAGHLAPLFVTDTADLPAARLMAARTIASHRPETLADLVNVARTVSFSMSALAALGRAASEAMAPPLQLRHWGRAATLSRCADQGERAMERRRRRQQGFPPPVPQAWAAAQAAEPRAEPAAEIPDLDAAELEGAEAAIAAAVAEAMRDYVATCGPAAATEHPEEAPDAPDACLPAPSHEPAWHPAALPRADDGPRHPSSAGPGPAPDGDPRPLARERREMDLIREMAARNPGADRLSRGSGRGSGQTMTAVKPPFTKLTLDGKTFASAATYSHDRQRERPDHAAGRKQHDPP